MKKFIKYGLIVFVLAFFFNGLTVIETNAQALKEILNRMEKHRQSMTTLRSDIMMSNYDSTLKDYDYSEGTILYAAVRDKKGRDTDALFRLDWKKPQEETLSVTNKQYILYRPTLNVAYYGASDSKNVADKGGNFLTVLTKSSKQDLQSKYTMQVIGRETLKQSVETIHLKLTPKAKEKFKHIDIWVDDDGMIHQVTGVMHNNDSQTFRLTNIKKNPSLDGNDFKVSVGNAKKVKA